MSTRPDADARPRLSVVMATYDGERFLPEMLDSLAAQDVLPDEMVVRDDASSDGTVRLLEDFAGRVPFPVKVIAGDERLGYARNFVTAAGDATGDLLFFADQDDTWRPEKLATVAKLYGDGESRAFFHDFTLVLGDGTLQEPSYFRLLSARGFGPEVSVKGCSMAVTRAFVDTWGWPPEGVDVSHDFWVALLSSAFGQRSYVDDVLVDHRLHDGNASGWIPTERSREFTRPGDGASDIAVLVDLVIKRGRVRRWSRAFLGVVAERGDDLDPAASRRLRSTLRQNRRRHLPPERA
jgi:glycosyltransferase involved in cell wall biosynthesis